MTSIHKSLFNSYDQHFVTHESSDFTRKSRKLSFKDTISFTLSIAGKPIRKELLDFLHYSNNAPAAYALVHARSKIFNIFWMNWIKHFHLTIYIRAIILLRLMDLKCKYRLIIVIPISYIKVHRKENFYLLFILMSAMMF